MGCVGICIIRNRQMRSVTENRPQSLKNRPLSKEKLQSPEDKALSAVPFLCILVG